MYYTDFVEIIRRPIEIPCSLQKEKTITLYSCMLDEHINNLSRVKSELMEKGFTLFKLNFSASGEDGQDITASITASRMETTEETAYRVERQEKYNEKVAKEQKERKDRAEIEREIKRITKGLSLEELRKIEKIRQ